MDDGSGNDSVAGDGIYSTGFVATKSGQYRYSVVASDNEFQLQFKDRAGVLEAGSSFSGQYSDIAVDDNGNGFYDRLDFSVEVDIAVAGDWDLLASLLDSSSNYLLVASKQEPYTSPTDYDPEDFEQAIFTPTGNHNDEGIDLDNDGSYDQLKIDVGFDVVVPGNYQIAGRLITPPGPAAQNEVTTLSASLRNNGAPTSDNIISRFNIGDPHDRPPVTVATLIFFG